MLLGLRVNAAHSVHCCRSQHTTMYTLYVQFVTDDLHIRLVRPCKYIIEAPRLDLLLPFCLALRHDCRVTRSQSRVLAMRYSTILLYTDVSIEVHIG